LRREDLAMGTEQVENHKMTITALESGTVYPDFQSAPEDPLLVEVTGIEESTLASISSWFGIDLDDLKDAMDPDERPRLQVEEGFTMLILKVPVNLEIPERTTSTLPVGIYTNGRDIVILRNTEIPSPREKTRRKIRESTTASEVIYSLWNTVTHSFEHMLDVIEHEINFMEDRILTEIFSSQLKRFFQLSRDSVFLETALKSNMRVLQEFKRVPQIGQMILSEERLDEIEVDLQQQLELSAIYRQLIENAMNAYDSIISNNLNQVIKILTSISLLVSVPTLIASVYGMNVGLPLQNESYAFLVVVAVTLVVILPVLYFLRKRNLV